MKIKALSKLKPEQGIWMNEVDMPELGHNDLLIKIKKTAICGTDVHIYNWDEWSQKPFQYLWWLATNTWVKWLALAKKCVASKLVIAFLAKATSLVVTAVTVVVAVRTCAATPLVWA